MNEVSCKECSNGTKAPKTDATDSLNSRFEGYWCEAYRSIVHDYFCGCPLFSKQKEAKQP